jgi:hypothetical protein
MSYHRTLVQNQQLVAHNCNPYTLLVGVICGSAKQIAPLLDDINNLSTKSFIQVIETHILLNGVSRESLDHAISEVNEKSSQITFNIIEKKDIEGTLPIGRARSILQKELGYRMDIVENSFVWILDDDMRIPKIAESYLTWLPLFKSEGIDVLIGNFEGSSPNPPAHGIRVQLNDLFNNLKWFDELNDHEILTDKSRDNERFRKKYPDYYYDLSRKHTEHLKETYWVVPAYRNETVQNARERILGSLDKILTGEPFLRPLVVSVPNNPIEASIPSCNRGGNTFVFNSSALKHTPNTVLLSNGSENRRSDMIWAIINRYYHGLKIQAVSFPVYHYRFISLNNEINLEKTVGEIKGSAVYAALHSFFDEGLKSSWCFRTDECEMIYRLYQKYIEGRLLLYKENFIGCEKLLDQIDKEYSKYGNRITQFISQVKKWINCSSLEYIDKTSKSETFENLSMFLNSIKPQIDNYV